MLQRLSRRIDDDQQGFTLIELLVVVLIIGILAAIALPVLLGQSAKAQDAAAKSNARNAVSQVEICHTATDSYSKCVDGQPDLDKGGINAAVEPAPGGYKVTATSDSNNTFSIKKTAAGFTRTCTRDSGGTDRGGCKRDNTW